MLHISFEDVSAQEVEQGAVGVTIRWLIGKDSPAPNFLMRHFTIAPGGHTPYHKHSWEHEVFILKGRGVVRMEDGERALQPYDTVFVAPNEMHNFRNAGDEPFEMLCLIPRPEEG